MTVCRQKRLALQMTQGRLAELAGIPQPYVSKIELRQNSVSLADMESVARVLGVDTEELMNEVTA